MVITVSISARQIGHFRGKGKISAHGVQQQLCLHGNKRQLRFLSLQMEQIKASFSSCSFLTSISLRLSTSAKKFCDRHEILSERLSSSFISSFSIPLPRY